MRRPRPDPPPRVTRAGWSSGSRRRRMFTVDGTLGSAPHRDTGPDQEDVPPDGTTQFDREPARPGPPRYRRTRVGRPDPDPPPGDRGPVDYPWNAQPHRPQPPTRAAGSDRPPLDEQSRDRASPDRHDYARFEPEPEPPAEPDPRRGDRQPLPPRKLTVTRVAAWRGRQLTGQGIRAFQRAAGADGADRSGLKALTYASMMDYATDAAVAVALANTLFFSAATAESKTRVALYLLITVAPFALVAPVIGPLLDRVQRGRRVALAASFVGRGTMALIMAFHFNDWGLYPAALGALVLSKSFTVLRAAVTPRVLPEAITLVTTNSRLTVFGLVAGGVFGAGAAGLAKITGSPGALAYTAVLCALGAWLCLRIPGWVEVTTGEVPASLRNGGTTAKRQPMGRRVVVSLWANGSIRVLTGFLMLFVAFVIKAQTEHNPSQQVMLLGIVGAAAGVGSVVGNAIGSKQQFDRSDRVVLSCVAVCAVGAASVAVLPGVTAAAVCALAAATASALAKVCLDAVIQRDLPERSRASAFGRSETVLQLSWVFGGALGVLLPPVYWIGFASVTAVVALGGLQSMLIGRGQSLLPWIRHREQPVIPYRSVS